MLFFIFIGVELFADNRSYLTLYLGMILFATILLVVIRRSSLPVTRIYRTVRAKESPNPLESLRLLLMPEFLCETRSERELVGVRRYGRRGMYQVSFHLTFDQETITVEVDCNGAFPDYFFVVHNTIGSLRSALRSCGYLQERKSNEG